MDKLPRKMTVIGISKPAARRSVAEIRAVPFPAPVNPRESPCRWRQPAGRVAALRQLSATAGRVATSALILRSCRTRT